MKIDKNIIEQLVALDLNLEELFILYCIANGYRYHERIKTWPASFYKLEKEGYIIKQTATQKGRDTIQSLNLLGDPTEVLDINQEFENWWEIYPSYDDHGRWERTRRIKINKVKSKELYTKLLRENIPPTLLRKALEADIELHIKNSIKENKLKYFPNPARWLYQREFEGYEDTSSETDINNYVEYGKKID